MIDRDLVLNKGFDMALALDNTMDKEPLETYLEKLKTLLLLMIFLEKQYFGKIAKRLRPKACSCMTENL